MVVDELEHRGFTKTSVGALLGITLFTGCDVDRGGLLAHIHSESVPRFTLVRFPVCSCILSGMLPASTDLCGYSYHEYRRTIL